jgi:hypothetical protein
MSHDSPPADVAEIEAEIDSTRRQISATLDELHGRLEPAALRAQAIERVRSSARLGVKRHPVAAITVVAGVAWLLLRAFLHHRRMTRDGAHP